MEDYLFLPWDQEANLEVLESLQQGKIYILFFCDTHISLSHTHTHRANVLSDLQIEETENMMGQCRHWSVSFPGVPHSGEAGTSDTVWIQSPEEVN